MEGEGKTWQKVGVIWLKMTAQHAESLEATMYESLTPTEETSS